MIDCEAAKERITIQQLAPLMANVALLGYVGRMERMELSRRPDDGPVAEESEIPRKLRIVLHDEHNASTPITLRGRVAESARELQVGQIIFLRGVRTSK